jgi:hypothetical protein
MIDKVQTKKVSSYLVLLYLTRHYQLQRLYRQHPQDDDGG